MQQPLGRHQDRQHALVLGPCRAEQVLALAQAVLAELTPERCLVGDDDLARTGLALAPERRHPLGREPLDGDVAQRPDRHRADDGIRGQAGAVGEHHLGPAVDRDPAHGRRQPQPVAQLGGHPQRDGGRALGDGLVLPHVVVVRPGAPATASIRSAASSEMRSPDPPAMPSAPTSRARTTFAAAPTSRSQAFIDSRSRRPASGWLQGSSGSTVRAISANSPSPARRRHGRRRSATGSRRRTMCPSTRSQRDLAGSVT